MADTQTPRLDAQMAFLNEIDKLKLVNRATLLCDGSRVENSAEHSWHIALYALILAEHAPQPIDITRVIKMLLLHDIVEIDAGDNPIHGEIDHSAVAIAEEKAADRIFGLLPADQGGELSSIWDEFEAAESDEAKFAKALDRFQPPNLNLASGGESWRTHNATLDKVETRVGTPIQRGAPALWHWIAPRIRAFFAAG